MNNDYEHLNEQIPDEEPWLVSYADMMTLLFGFFVILYSFSTLDDAKFNTVTESLKSAFNKDQKEKVSRISGEIDDERKIKAMELLLDALKLGDGGLGGVVEAVEKAKFESQTLDSAKAMLNAKFAPRLDLPAARELELFAKEKALIINLPAGKMFEKGSVKLSRRAKALLDEVVSSIRLLGPEIDIEITGHASATELVQLFDGQLKEANALSGNAWALSSARAGSVAREINLLGIDSRRIHATGVGDSRPIIAAKSVNSAAATVNQRIEITLTTRRLRSGGDQ